jgi:hypothetical protein
MEGKSAIDKVKQIFKKNFIGFEELNQISLKLGINIPNNIENNIPEIPYSEDVLLNLKDEYILVLGIPFYKDGSELTIVKLREHFGWNPDKYEPCFYNQDWYLKEEFANTSTIDLKWYLIKKEVNEETRSISPDIIINELDEQQYLPSALLTVYTFFVFALLESEENLWEHDYIWCSDVDHNGDRIYTGRYIDSTGINKRGFSIHRHLSLSKIYGSIHCL